MPEHIPSRNRDETRTKPKRSGKKARTNDEPGRPSGLPLFGGHFPLEARRSVQTRLDESCGYGQGSESLPLRLWRLPPLLLTAPVPAFPVAAPSHTASARSSFDVLLLGREFSTRLDAGMESPWCLHFLKMSRWRCNGGVAPGGVSEHFEVLIDRFEVVVV
ncbi:hypothetical protein KC19_1G189100 [Ceratodon purpureus]|uniref:Uncharacterized protein n=1 Tax=Ceratodon purpureus TaxID=3225 RepID=A0A8T0J8X4_CERPU|nr:hypothetical protein KC19_1G189100 [Ceratodon purpureus]